MNKRFWVSFSLIIGVTSTLFGLSQNIEAKKTKEIKILEESTPISKLPVPALSAQEQRKLLVVRPDPAPEEIVRNSHYWVSNEHNHQLWLPYINGIGGAYIGVGTDQNYLLAGWANSSLLILMDFDQEIAILHQIYAYFFSISDTPEMLLDRWSKTYGEDSAQKLTKHFTALAQGIAKQEADNKNLSIEKRNKYITRRVKKYVRRRVKMFKRTRGLLWRRLSKTKKKYQELKIATFLDDLDQYNHIRGLWAGGRVLALRGDLTANLTMLDLSNAIKELGETLNILYVSNAEQYFPLTPEYRRNLIYLPWGEKSFILRTMAWGSLGFYDEKEEYHYNIQTGANLVEWMKKSRTTKAGRMMFKGRKLIVDPGFSEMVKLPVESKRLPKIAPIPNAE